MAQRIQTVVEKGEEPAQGLCGRGAPGRNFEVSLSSTRRDAQLQLQEFYRA